MTAPRSEDTKETIQRAMIALIQHPEIVEMSAPDEGWTERVKLARNSNFREILCFLANAGMRLRAVRLAADVLKIPVLEARDYVDKIHDNWRAITPDWPLPKSMLDKVRL